MVHHRPPGVLLAAGPDRLDLLHRMSTNELESLAVGSWRQSVFTDPVGRTIDLVSVLQEEQRAVLVGLPGRGDRLHGWLRRHIFFQDQVSLEQPEQPWSMWGLYGPEAGSLLGVLSGRAPAGEQFSRFGSGYCWMAPSSIGGLLIAGPASDVDPRLKEYGGQPVDQQAYQVLRIEAGLPAADREILDDSIPLEIGLRPAISFTKGCYVGQEIIARMDSRGQLAKQLVRLRFDGPVEAGSMLELDGSAVGTVTSAAQSPASGWIGLGIVRSQAADEPELRVAGDGRRATLEEP